MSSPVLNVFTPSDLEYLNNLPEVLEAKARLDNRKVVYFSIPLTESLRATLEEHLNLDLSTVSSIPLRWIKGDTPSHIDHGASAFEHTYLVYVNDSEGSLVLGSEAYPIQANTAFVFSEGIHHRTEGTGLEPRLLVGPMNELAEPVGAPVNPCFKEGTKILCQINGVETYQAIETLTVGTLVKTSRDGYKKIELIGSGTIHNPGTQERIEDRLYKCSTANYPELTEDLYITGNHCILVESLTGVQRQQLVKQMGKLYSTDDKYRLIACVDQRAEPLASEGVFPIWHLALEHEDIRMNYGIYVNGGLLVETCSINTLRNRSNLVGV